MTTRERLLELARELAIEKRAIPSMDTLAAAAGISKGGLTHHLPTRGAIVAGLADAALAEMDGAMADAAARGECAAVWLRLSVPDDAELDLYRAMAVATRALSEADGALLDRAAAAADRWEALLAVELGDPRRARLVRLVGDGLLANAVTGVPLSGAVSVEDLLDLVRP